MTAGQATVGTRLVSATGAVGMVVDVVRLDCDPDHVGLRIATADGVSNALFPIDAPLTVAA